MKGVTLLEILIAIIIMTIGLAGILALFQPALRASRTTMEETTAVVIAESIRDALTNALKRAQEVADPNDATRKLYKITVYHDGFDIDKTTNVDNGMYGFYLPRFLPKDPVTGFLPRDNYNEWGHHPDDRTTIVLTNPITYPIPIVPIHPDLCKKPLKSPDKTLFTPQDTHADNKLFILNKEIWITKVTKELEKTDQTDPYEQFLFSFDVRKEDTGAVITPDPGGNKDKDNDNHDRMSTLYGFMLHIFRAKGPINVENTWETEKEHIRTFQFQIGVSVQ